MKSSSEGNRKSGKVKTDSRTDSLKFPVAGIGASAGGLEALQEFFKSMPKNPGAAFVIVQHLSPDYKSLMDELLARCTSMVIHRVEDGMRIQENHIYLIPPRKNMTIFQGKLLLTEQNHGKTLNLPIDIFLRSLAKDQEKNAIGIILSGTGSDGTLGIRAIKEFGGIAMVQDDRSAKFDGMPRSSISTGMVDFILPPAKLADELVNYIKHPFIKKTEQLEQLINKDESQLSKVIAIIRDAKGVDFSEYKDNTIIRRLEKRISINRFNSVDEYIQFLTNNNREINTLFSELLIGVTRFFRDEESFAMLKKEIVPELFKDANFRKELRVWVTGCSTGEEPYSIAILIDEYMKENNISRDVKIFATDIDSQSLEYAGVGLYPESIASDISPDRLSRYFVRREGGYQINEHIRSMIIFARHDILNDPPFSKIDLISCRNLLIYLNNQAQQKVLSIFYLAFAENGFLFLGSSESIGNQLSEGFKTIDSKAKLYKKEKGFYPPHFKTFGTSTVHKTRAELHSVSSFYKPAKPKVSVLDGIFDEILGDFVPPSVILDEHFDIVHTIHEVGKYVSLPVGHASLNLLKMLPKELSVMVSGLLRRAEKSQTEVILSNINLPGDEKKEISLAARKIKDKKNEDVFFLVSFTESEKKKVTKKVKQVEKISLNSQYLERIDQLEKELQFKSESLQATVEELETSNEELQSSNEELIASNEELQSTNEELQSVNEELYTVNSEHIKKIEELTELNADMDNLLKNTNIGTLFLDQDLTIRKANNIAANLTNIRLSDIGRPIQHLSFNSLYPEFIGDIKSVMETLVPREHQIISPSKTWYLMQIIPYRTAENAVGGIIITFVDISRLKESEAHAEELSNRLDMAMEMGGISWWTWNYKNNEVQTGKLKYQMLGYKKGEIGSTFQEWTRLIHPDDHEKAMEAMRNHLSGKAQHYNVEYRIKARDGSYRWYYDKGGVVSRSKDGSPLTVTGVVMDVTSEKEEGLIVERFKILFDTINFGIVYQDTTGAIIDANPAAERILGLSVDQMKGLKSIDPRWKSMHEDGSDFPGETHPAMVALKTGEPQKDVIMGVFNPVTDKHTWININAIPLFRGKSKVPYQVYTTFEDITDKMGNFRG